MRIDDRFGRRGLLQEEPRSAGSLTEMIRLKKQLVSRELQDDGRMVRTLGLH